MGADIIVRFLIAFPLVGPCIAIGAASSCADENDEGTGDEDDNGVGDGITVSGYIGDFMSEAPLQGARICVFGSDAIPCTKTNDSGHYVIENVPSHSDVTFELTASSYWSYLTNFTTTGEDRHFVEPMNILKETEVQLVAASLGIEMDPSKSHIAVNVYDAPIPDYTTGMTDVSASLSPEAGGLLHYMDEDETVTADLTATTSNGFLGWINVEPGQWTVTLDHPTLECMPDYAFAGQQPGTFRVSTTAGYTTWIFVYCD